MWPRLIPLPGTLVLILILSTLVFKFSNQQSGVFSEALDSENTQINISTEPAETKAFQRAFKPDVFYVAITERPLFSPDRRPQLTELEEIEVEISSAIMLGTTSEVVSDFLLHGTMISDGVQSALISFNETPAEWIRENGLISGWNLSDINPEVVELQKGSEVILIYLFENGR